MKRIVCLLMAMCIILAGCAGNTGSTSTADTSTGEPVVTPEVTSEESQTEASEVSEEVSAQTQEPASEVPEVNPSLLGFSGNGEILVDKLFDMKGGNVVISDTSINLALAMLLEATNGESQKQLETYLGITKDDAKEYSKKLINAFNDRDSENLRISVANSIWADEKLEIRKEYVDLLSEYFDAESENLDFTDPSTADKINAWVSEKTHGLINEIIDQGQVSQLASVLINAIYFKGTWAEQYLDVQKGEFNGKTVDVLKCGVDDYFENDKATAFAKPYYGGFEFIGILPKEAGDFTLEELDIEGLLNSRTNEYDVITQVPKFKVEYSAELPEILMGLGIEDVFNPSVADLSDMADGMYVDNVIHKTYINLDENGTEAAAVTAITVKNSMSISEKETKEVILDRDFVFIIYDTETHTALFTGKIVNVD